MLRPRVRPPPLVLCDLRQHGLAFSLAARRTLNDTPGKFPGKVGKKQNKTRPAAEVEGRWRPRRAMRLTLLPCLLAFGRLIRECLPYQPSAAFRSGSVTPWPVDPAPALAAPAPPLVPLPLQYADGYTVMHHEGVRSPWCAVRALGGGRPYYHLVSPDAAAAASRPRAGRMGWAAAGVVCWFGGHSTDGSHPPAVACVAGPPGPKWGGSGGRGHGRWRCGCCEDWFCSLRVLPDSRHGHPPQLQLPTMGGCPRR